MSQDPAVSGLSVQTRTGGELPPFSSGLPIVVGGLSRFSLVDWPGRIVATVFCRGCGWRCRYCHNPGLISFATSDAAESGWSWSEVLAWLRDRRGLLDGVVFSGGEPLLQRGLSVAMVAVRELGFRVGLHTGGPLPLVLAEVLPLVDWVGLDFKAPWDDYAAITGRPAGEAVRESLRLVLAAGVAHEIRTTWHPDLLSPAALARMADALAEAGVRAWVIQPFREEGCADPTLFAPAASPDLALLRRPNLEVRLRE